MGLGDIARFRSLGSQVRIRIARRLADRSVILRTRITKLVLFLTVQNCRGGLSPFVWSRGVPIDGPESQPQGKSVPLLPDNHLLEP